MLTKAIYRLRKENEEWTFIDDDDDRQKKNDYTLHISQIMHLFRLLIYIETHTYICIECY